MAEEEKEIPGRSEIVSFPTVFIKSVTLLILCITTQVELK